MCFPPGRTRPRRNDVTHPRHRSDGPAQALRRHARARRHRPRGARGLRLRPPRSQRRRQDHRRAHPHHARRRRWRLGSRRGLRRRPRAERGPPPHRPGRPGRDRRRAADRPREPRDDRRAAPPAAAASRGAGRAELLEQFDLADAGDKLAKDYSGGMRRRLDLAATLVARPTCCSSTSRRRASTRERATSCGPCCDTLVERRHHPAADHPVPRGGRPARPTRSSWSTTAA